MRKKLAVYLCMGLLLATAGCSQSDSDSNASTADTITVNDAIDSNETDSNEIDSNEIDSNEIDSNEIDSNAEENEQLQSDSELDGSIESIGDNKVVINKTLHPSADTSVSHVNSDKILVTVYFSEETEFEVWTIKNGGVNGDADIEKQPGAFSDLKQDVTINLTGNYEGTDFHARHVIIYNFI